MIRLLSLDVNEFVFTWIPSHRRWPMAVQLFQKLATPFRVIMEEFLVWRNAAVTRTYVTGETICLEWYLNELFDPVNRGIYIETAPASGVAAGIEGLPAPEPYFVNGIEVTEPTDFELIALPGEAFLYGTASFVVNVPAAIAAQEEAIGRVVRVYKMAGKSFMTLMY